MAERSTTAKGGVSRRDFLRLATVGLALATLVAPWRRLIPGGKQGAAEGTQFSPGSLFKPRIKR